MYTMIMDSSIDEHTAQDPHVPPIHEWLNEYNSNTVTTLSIHPQKDVTQAYDVGTVRE